MAVPPDTHRPGSFVEWRHAQVSTPRSVLDNLVHRAVGARIDRLNRVVEGYDNEVYRVRCVDGQDVVVRVLRFGQFAGDLTRSASESWAIRSARAAGVPAPEILLNDTVRIEGADFPVMVQRTVSGRPLADVVDLLSERQRHDLLAEIGELIARLHQIPVEDEDRWENTMADELADRRAEREQILAGGISAAQFDQMLHLLEGCVHDFPSRHSVLCHGDLGPKHIFVTGDGSDGRTVRVSGIIDFGDWKPGPSVHDLAILRVRGPQLDLAPLLAGYGAHPDTTEQRQLDPHTLNIALSSLRIGVDENDQACITRSGTLLGTLLANLGDRHLGRPGGQATSSS